MSFGAPQHLSAVFLKWSENRAAWMTSDELLERFAAKHGYQADEIERVFGDEELEHDAKECRLPGCVREFRNPPKPAKPHKIGAGKRNNDEAERESRFPAFPCGKHSKETRAETGKLVSLSLPYRGRGKHSSFPQAGNGGIGKPGKQETGRLAPTSRITA